MANFIYASHHHVNEYFERGVALLTCQPEVALKHLLAMLKLCSFEHNKRDALKLETQEVCDTLVKQKRSYATFIGSQVGVLNDPQHKLPADVVTLSDTRRAMRYVLGTGDTSFANICSTWTCGTQCFLRGASMRVLTITDLTWDVAHGPV